VQKTYGRAHAEWFKNRLFCCGRDYFVNEIFNLDHLQDMAHFFFFGLKVFDVQLVMWNINKPSPDNFQAVTCQAYKFPRVFS
jgi:hypothetical protein